MLYTKHIIILFIHFHTFCNGRKYIAIYQSNVSEYPYLQYRDTDIQRYSDTETKIHYGSVFNGA